MGKVDTRRTVIQLSKKIPIGKVEENSTASFELVANHGYSFEEKESLEFDIIFLIEITYD